MNNTKPRRGNLFVETMMKNIYLNGLDKQAAPTELNKRFVYLFYKQIASIE